MTQDVTPPPLVRVLNVFTLVSTVLCYGVIVWLVVFHRDLFRYYVTDYTQLRHFITPELRVPLFLVGLFFSVALSIWPVAQLVPLVSMAAFFYGFEWGMAFGGLSFFFATALTMTLSRHMGTAAVKRVIGAKNWEKANLLADREGSLPYLIAYLLPLFPNSIVSWIAGTTRLPILPLSGAALISQLPGIAVSVLIGSGLVMQNRYLTGGTFFGLVALAIVLHYNRPRLLALLGRDRRAA